MKRQHLLLTDSDTEPKRLKTSPTTPNAIECESGVSSLSETVSILPSVVLRRIGSLMLAEDTKPMNKKTEKESFFNQIRLAGMKRTLRQCVLTHNQQASKRQLRVSLNRQRSDVCINGNFKCGGEVVEQVKAAFRFFYPNELLVVFQHPRLKRAKRLLEALADIDLSSVKVLKMKIQATASVSQQLLSCLPFTQQLTHIKIKLFEYDVLTHVKYIKRLFKAVGQCCNVELIEFDDSSTLDKCLFNGVRRSMQHLAQLPKLQAIDLGFFYWWDKWEELQPKLYNEVPAATSQLCLSRTFFRPDSTSAVDDTFLLSEASRNIVKCICCVQYYNDFYRLFQLVEGILESIPNCSKVVFADRHSCDETKEEVDQMFMELLKKLEDTGDRRMKIEMVFEELLCWINYQEENLGKTGITWEKLEYTLGERSIVVNYEPEDGITCVFDCFK